MIKQLQCAAALLMFATGAGAAAGGKAGSHCRKLEGLVSERQGLKSAGHVKSLAVAATSAYFSSSSPGPA